MRAAEDRAADRAEADARVVAGQAGAKADLAAAKVAGSRVVIAKAKEVVEDRVAAAKGVVSRVVVAEARGEVVEDRVAVVSRVVVAEARGEAAKEVVVKVDPVAARVDRAEGKVDPVAEDSATDSGLWVAR